MKGLKNGDTIVTTGLMAIRPKAKIKISKLTRYGNKGLAMNISELSLRRPVLAFVMSIVLVLFGLGDLNSWA